MGLLLRYKLVLLPLYLNSPSTYHSLLNLSVNQHYHLYENHFTEQLSIENWL